MKQASTMMFCVLFVALTLTVFAQAPTGIISGTVTDQSGAVMPVQP